MTSSFPSKSVGLLTSRSEEAAVVYVLLYAHHSIGIWLWDVVQHQTTTLRVLYCLEPCVRFMINGMYQPSGEDLCSWSGS